MLTGVSAVVVTATWFEEGACLIVIAVPLLVATASEAECGARG
ncbi:hypothetical protein [Streptomyces sp. NBC_01340]